MIIIMKPSASDEAIRKVTDIIESKGLQAFSGESPIEPRKHQHRPCRNGHRSPVGQRSIPPSPTTSGEPKPSP